MKPLKTDCFDVVVSGSGLVGASIGLGLADAGHQVAIIEPTVRKTSTQPSHDQRTLVLNAASLNILQSLKLLPPTLVRQALKEIVINRQGGLGHLHLKARDHQAIIGQDTDPEDPFFGQVVVAKQLGEAMLERLDAHPNITQYCPNALVDFAEQDKMVTVHLDDGRSITGRILVASDGTNSPIRERLRERLDLAIDRSDYGQSAMVFNVAASKPLEGVAFERFTPQGPLALLPQPKGRYGVVWIDSHQAIQQAMEWSDGFLVSQLRQRFGAKLGEFDAPSTRTHYPLIKQHCPQCVVSRVVLVGNAANTVHPVSAQGFNLGLRDVAGLIDAIGSNGLGMPMGQDHLERCLVDYQSNRRADQRATIRYTDTLARAFSHKTAAVRLFSGLGLAFHAASPALTRRLVRAAMGFRAPVSSLARGSHRAQAQEPQEPKNG